MKNRDQIKTFLEKFLKLRTFFKEVFQYILEEQGRAGLKGSTKNLFISGQNIYVHTCDQRYKKLLITFQTNFDLHSQKVGGTGIH